MRASAAIDDHQGAFWGGHLNAGGVATITKCVSPGSGKRAPGSPELDLHTRRINAHSACSHMPSPATTDVGVRTDSTFLLSSPFVHPVCRAPAREWSEWDERNRRGPSRTGIVCEGSRRASETGESMAHAWYCNQSLRAIPNFPCYTSGILCRMLVSSDIPRTA